MAYVPGCVLLTGGAGFIGSNTLCHLVTKYPDIVFVCLDKMNYCASMRNLAEIADQPNFKFVKGDITSGDLVNHVFEQYSIDTVLHFAAQSHVDNSFGNSLDFTMANVLGTHVLLEAARVAKVPIRRFIHVSTDEVYGEAEMPAYHEKGEEKAEDGVIVVAEKNAAKHAKELDDFKRCTPSSALNPTNPYAATKTAAEFLCRSYAHSFGLPVIITRGNNVYGPKQYPEKIIPKFINLLMRGQPCPLHGDGTHLRSYLYVDDVARAFETVLFKGVVGQIYNIGSSYELSNLQTLRALLKLFGWEDKEHQYVRYVKDRAFSDARYHVESSALEQLGWSQQVDFETGISLTRDWYMKTDSVQHWNADIATALRAHPGSA